jgi:hypothetical protein
MGKRLFQTEETASTMLQNVKCGNGGKFVCWR